MDFVAKNGRSKTIEELIVCINNLRSKQSTRLIGIDGCGGSGKSTFANRLKEHCRDVVTIVHMDDFYLPSTQIKQIDPLEKPVGADYDWKRLLVQVLEPLSHHKKAKYQRYDWESDELAEWQTIPPGGTVIIEGVYSIREELADKYDLTIWVDCPREVRLERGLERDGEEAREMWENNWMLSEDLYIKAQQPCDRADIVVDGTR